MSSRTFYRSSVGESVRAALFAGLVAIQLLFDLPVWIVVLTVAAALVSIAGVYSNRTRPMVVLEEEAIRFKPGLLRPEDRLSRDTIVDWHRDGGSGVLDPGRFVLETAEDDGDLVIPERALGGDPDELADALEEWWDEG